MDHAATIQLTFAVALVDLSDKRCYRETHIRHAGERSAHRCCIPTNIGQNTQAASRI
jgi:hypothetical protein